ncbi:hypothetical protein L208DRAFT_1414667, partial [Tricholoma matsutake]
MRVVVAGLSGRLAGSCNPFPTDVYYLGNLIRQEFLEVILILFQFITILIHTCL